MVEVLPISDFSPTNSRLRVRVRFSCNKPFGTFPFLRTPLSSAFEAWAAVVVRCSSLLVFEVLEADKVAGERDAEASHVAGLSLRSEKQKLMGRCRSLDFCLEHFGSDGPGSA